MGTGTGHGGWGMEEPRDMSVSGTASFSHWNKDNVTRLGAD